MTTQDTTESLTPTLDTVLAAVTVLVPAHMAWALRGWAARLRETRHQNHAASSWAKHQGEFGLAEDLAAALTVARCLDFGMEAADAAELLRARVNARALKLAA